MCSIHRAQHAVLTPGCKAEQEQARKAEWDEMIGEAHLDVVPGLSNCVSEAKCLPNVYVLQ